MHLENYDQIILQVLKFFAEKYWPYWPEDLAVLFSPNQEAFINELITDYASDPKMMRLVFDVIGHAFPERKSDYLRQLLKINHDFEIFRQLNLVKAKFFGSIESLIPWKEQRIQDWKAIEEVFAGLRPSTKFFKHRDFVKKQIDWLKRDIEEEKHPNTRPKVIRADTLPEFTPILTPELKHLYRQIKEQFPFLDFAIWTTRWLNHWVEHLAGKFYTLVEVEGDHEEAHAVFSFLKSKEEYPEVFLDPDAKEIENYLGYTQDTLIVRNLREDAPIVRHLIPIASLEKILVNIFCEPILFAMYQEEELENIYVNVFTNYQLDEQKMIQYAESYNQANEIQQFIYQTHKLINTK
ncbi:MAG: hypothetical protein HC880_20025 [Bacteroidia bacterium]|nr:hypothetical protein [Bacteroidia bacterium]